MIQKSDETDDGSLYADEPAIRLSCHHVYDGTNVHLGPACTVITVGMLKADHE